MQPVFRDWGYCVIDTAARMARQTRESAEAVAIAALMECGQFEGKYSDLVKTYLADPYDQVQASRAILYDTAVASAIATREQK